MPDKPSPQNATFANDAASRLLAMLSVVPVYELVT
jgi:hypothetical protein